VGADDRTITLEGAEIVLTQIRDVQLYVFGGCGHWVKLERQVDRRPGGSERSLDQLHSSGCVPSSCASRDRNPRRPTPV
jgi:pimeloyl-ACP methyl ester carboxylesterase